MHRPPLLPADRAPTRLAAATARLRPVRCTRTLRTQSPAAQHNDGRTVSTRIALSAEATP